MSSSSSSSEEILTTGDGRSIMADEIISLYRDAVNLATPCSGQIIKSSETLFGLVCNFSATDCDTLEVLTTTRTYSAELSVSGSEKRIKSVNPVSYNQLCTELSSVTSLNGRFCARLKGGKGAKSKEQLLEIWDRSRLVRTFEIEELEQHGPINVDGVFSSMQWCPFGEQNKLLYICQKKKPKPQSYFKYQQVKDGKPRQENNLRVDDWGEQLSGIEHTLAAIIDLSDMSIKTIDLPGFSLADSRWVDEKRIIACAVAEKPKKLGLIYCNNRKSKLVIYDLLANTFTDIDKDGRCLYSPRITNDGEKLVYLESLEGGAHFHTVALNFHDLKTNQTTQLKKGLFIDGLHNNCFSADGKSVLFVNRDHLRSHLCMIDLTPDSSKSAIHEIKFPTSDVDIYDFRNDIILASGSEINSTPTLYVATLTTPDLVSWHQIEDCIHFDEIKYETSKIITADKTSFNSAILISPNLKALSRNFNTQDTSASEASLPTMVTIHGGPHSNFDLGYEKIWCFHARLGLKILLINYRGSTGVSEEYLQCLNGNIGEQDVEDCLQVIRHFVESKAIDPDKLILYGGSHSGFIACHLSCQKEFKFTSAIIRNPVVDPSTLYQTSDIPDWTLNQALGHKHFDPGWQPDATALQSLFKCSPLTKYKDAYVPTLMLLGSQDRRVNMYQGEHWVELLKAQGIEVKCKVYADTHALAKPDVSADARITAVIFMLQHLNKS